MKYVPAESLHIVGSCTEISPVTRPGLGWARTVVVTTKSKKLKIDVSMLVSFDKVLLTLVLPSYIALHAGRTASGGLTHMVRSGDEPETMIRVLSLLARRSVQVVTDAVTREA